MKFPQQQYKLCQYYEPWNILNLDKLGLFFKALPEKGLMEKGKKVKGGRNLNKVWLLFSLLLLMALSFLKQLLSEDQKGNDVLNPLKIP